MQDIHSIGGGGGRFYGGSGGDRRLKLNQPQPVKCPRCDSLNTKFCYYNNYNLSQPRHFCKSCRRYWTKGGILRNVPVGGGCRKSKLSKPKPSTTVPTTVDMISQGNKSNSNSSSESSSTLTAANTSVVVTPEVGSGNSSNSNLPDFPDSRLFIPESGKETFILQVVGHTTEEEIFKDIEAYAFNMNNISMYQNSNDQQPKIVGSGPAHGMKMHEMSTAAAGFYDRTVQVELSGRIRANDGGLAPVDWLTGGGDDGGLFGMMENSDHEYSYWYQRQWGENDRSFNYLP